MATIHYIRISRTEHAIRRFVRVWAARIPTILVLGGIGALAWWVGVSL